MKPVQELEFGGGLGDIIHQCYAGTYYKYLDRAGVDYARAKVFLVTHNPGAIELFKWHPKKDLFDVVECGYWLPHQNKEMRGKWGIPPQPAVIDTKGPVVFYPSPEDLEILKAVEGRRFVVIAQAAGMHDRNLDPQWTKALCVRLVEEFGVDVALTGKNYGRYGRTEDMLGLTGRGIHEFIDRLSVPGTLRLLQQSVGLVTCHSAMNLAGWHMRKPQLLLYPKSVYDRHFARGDQWSFGRSFPETHHACWDDKALVEKKVNGFLMEIKAWSPSPILSTPAK